MFLTVLLALLVLGANLGRSIQGYAPFPAHVVVLQVWVSSLPFLCEVS